MKSTLLALVALLGLFSVSAMAADATGKWVADVPGRNGNVQQTFDLKVDGSTVTGTVTSPRGTTEISDGKVDGANISFNVVMSFNGNDFKLNFKGVLGDGTIHFVRTREGGDASRAQEFDAKLAK